MATPEFSPTHVCLKLPPGTTHRATVALARVPSAAEVTALIAPADPAIRIDHVAALRTVHRPFTEEEINELPPVPPSLRERARRVGTTETVEVGRSDGNTPLAVPAGARLEIEIVFAAAVAPPADTVAAALHVAAAGWTPADVRLVLLIGAGSFVPIIEPARLRCVAAPGEVGTEGFVIRRVPGAAKVMAHVEEGGTIVTLKRLRVMRPVHRSFSPDEIGELPPYPPSIRANARKNGYMEYLNVHGAGSCKPLAVAKGYLVAGEVWFAAPTQQPPDTVAATLVVEATTWARAELPITLTIGRVDVVPSTGAVAVRQGEAADLSLTLTSVAGASTDVELGLGMDGGQWTITPATVHVPRGATVTVAARIAVNPCAPTGSFPVGIEVLAFDRLQFRRVPLQLDVQAGAVEVRPQQAALAALQGNRVVCSVQVASKGYKRFGFSAGRMPDGVRLDAPLREIGCAARTTTIELGFVVAANATPVVAGRVAIRWSAGDDEHTGAFDVALTVQRRPEERTFKGQITTPPGTALGGWAAITIRNDGTWTFSGHLHDSGFDPYAFRVGVTVRTPLSAGALIAVAAHKSGEVTGTLGSGSRDFDWNESGRNDSIELFWPDLRNGVAQFTKSYDDTGVLGTLEDIVGAVGDFFAAAVLLSLVVGGAAATAVAGAVVVGSELGVLPGVVGGVLAAGPWLLILGPGVVLPVVVAGAVANALARRRPLNAAETAIARSVFADTLPLDRIRITDMTNPTTSNQRAFTVPDTNRSILVGVGDRFDDLSGSAANRATLVHELTHAWQIAHAPFPPAFYFKVAIDKFRGDEAYQFGAFDGRDWSDYGTEQQASIVGSWYQTFEPLGIDGQGALNSPWFGYIQNNIRMAQP